MKVFSGVLVFLLLLLLPPTPASGAPYASIADIEEHLGRRLDKTLWFTRQDGARVRLADVLEGQRPTVLVLAYYRCPTLCGLVLRGLVEGLKGLDTPVGEAFHVLTVSIDPRDTPDAAGQKRDSAMAALGQPEAKDAWPFLVGEEASIKALADELGFRYTFDPRTDQYAHPAVAFVLTNDGRISRYLYGVRFSQRDLRLALAEAGEGKTGSIVDRILLTCYRYDPATRRYGPLVWGFVRLGGALILASVIGLLLTLWAFERRQKRALSSEERGGRGERGRER